MPVPFESLPGELVILKRDEIRDHYLRDVRLRIPGAVTIEGTLEYADASVFADAMVPVFFDAKNIGDYVADVNKKGAALDIELLRAGTLRLPETGGSGYVQISAGIGGGTIFQNDELNDQATGLKFRCLATSLYTDGQYVPIIGVDTGPSTNLEPGKQLQWTAPRPGINPIAVIVAQSDGTGLSGGRYQETDPQANERLRFRRANPPAAGNSSQYREAILKTPGLSIQQAFTWECIFGPGSIAITFTLQPGTPGANRIPNSTQLAAAHAWIQGQFPGDDSILLTSLIAYPVDLEFEVLWAPTAVAWQDAAPWPPRINGNLIKVNAGTTPTTTTFRLTTSTSTINPQVGQSIAIYDQANGIFRRKRILSFTTVVANKSWDIVCDIINGASDVNYIPIVGQPVGPWSDSLQVLVLPITSYFDGLGPGEQLDVLPDPNLRQHRSPRSPATYGNTITNRLSSPLFALPAVGDIELKSPDVPFDTPVGAPGILAYLLALGNIVAFPQT